MGDCGATTEVQMAMFRLAGIAPISFQYAHPEGIVAYTHNFPAHYNPMIKTWFSVQKPHFIGSDGKEITDMDILFYYTKPFWHFLDYTNNRFVEIDGTKSYIYCSFYQGELVTSQRLKNFLTQGIMNKHIETFFYTHITMTPGTIFTKTTAPETISDRDADGLADIIEADLGTNAGTWDSDEDYISDRAEFEAGYDPFDAGSPGKGTTIVLDGYTDDIQHKKGYVDTIDPGGDCKVKVNSFDIAQLYAIIDNNTLYVGVTYHNTISGQKALQHELWITKAGSNPVQYWIGGGWNLESGVYEIGTYNLKVHRRDEWISLETGPETAKCMVMRNFELAIPLSLLEDPTSLKIKYSVMCGPEGKEIRAADETGEITVDFQ